PKPSPARRAPRPAPAPEPPRRSCPAPTGAGGDLLDRVQERLGPEPLLVDELIRQCHASTAEVQQALLELELDGRLERHPGNRVSLASA
ncbi:MAG: processing protein DprA, partial [Geminicoccaceae bacterium]|nr:processing protein DprA [Geminicoccaceae bacterium]